MRNVVDVDMVDMVAMVALVAMVPNDSRWVCHFLFFVCKLVKNI